MSIILFKVPVVQGNKNDRDLSLIFRKILNDRSISEAEINDKIRLRYASELSAVLSEDETITAVKMIKEEFYNPNMSWESFLNALRVIGVTDFTMLI
jgi:hypothetical protein